MRVENASSIQLAKLTKVEGEDLKGKSLNDLTHQPNKMAHNTLPETSDSREAMRVYNEKLINEAVERANKALEGLQRRFEYSVHKETHQIIVRVIDTESNEVVREIPPEKILDIIAGLWKLAGLIVDERI